MSNDKIKFEFVNESKTNFLQHKVVQKLASYFKIPIKLLRAGLDEDLAKDNILSFTGFSEQFRDQFYCTSCKFKASDMFSEDKLAKSKLRQLYVMKPESDAIFTVISGTEVFIWTEVASKWLTKGVGGIYCDFECMPGPMLLMPLKAYLEARYPQIE